MGSPSTNHILENIESTNENLLLLRRLYGGVGQNHGLEVFILSIHNIGPAFNPIRNLDMLIQPIRIYHVNHVLAFSLSNHNKGSHFIQSHLILWTNQMLANDLINQ